MTIRKKSSTEALRLFTDVASKFNLLPLHHAGVSNGPPQDAIRSVEFCDPVFSSPWWGHATGHCIGNTFDPTARLTGAYGEMIENVSCDIWYPDWLSCQREIIPLWDEELVNTERCVASLPVGSGVRHTIECSPTKLHRAHTYANIIDATDKILFPREIGLEVAGRNNGGAVGSEASEAIVTGLYEIFERYVLGKFSLRTEKFPLIDPNAFELTRVERIAQFLKLKGFETLYVDMSLGGRLPVIGVLLLNPLLDKMSIAVAGSHRVLDAAEHCLREMLSDACYKDSLIGWPANLDAIELTRIWVRSGFTIGWGGSLAQIDFARGYSNDYKQAFHESAKNNDDLLRKGIDSCRKFGAEVYVRDCSILGVQAFHVYVSVLSENLFVAHEGILSVSENAKALAMITKERWLQSYLPILDECKAGKFDNWLSLYHLLENPFLGYPNDEDVCDYFNWPITLELESAQKYRGVSLTTLIAGLAYHSGDFHKAVVLWRQTDTLRLPMHDMIGHFLDLAAATTNLSIAKKHFATAFGESRLADVEREISINALIKIPLRSEDNVIERHWRRFRDQIYPQQGSWSAKPFELKR